MYKRNIFSNFAPKLILSSEEREYQGKHTQSLSMSVSIDTESVTAAQPCVGDAVGVESSKWFVAIVKNNTEKSVQERLTKSGHETYVATQKVIRVWKNGRKAKVDKVLLPSMVFVKCTEPERKEIVALPFISRFMTNKAGAAKEGMTKPLAVIPQEQIDTLRFMLGQSDVPVNFVDTPYRPHDRVVVVRGNLRGLEGEVVKTTDGKSELIIRVDILGCAQVTINAVDLEPAR